MTNLSAAGPSQANTAPPSEERGSALPKARVATSVGGLDPDQPGPRNRLCRAVGAAAPSGGSAVRAATSVGVITP